MGRLQAWKGASDGRAGVRGESELGLVVGMAKAERSSPVMKLEVDAEWKIHCSWCWSGGAVVARRLKFMVEWGASGTQRLDFREEVVGFLAEAGQFVFFDQAELVHDRDFEEGLGPAQVVEGVGDLFIALMDQLVNLQVLGVGSLVGVAGDRGDFVEDALAKA